MILTAFDEEIWSDFTPLERSAYRDMINAKIAKGELSYNSVRVFFALKTRAGMNYKPPTSPISMIMVATGLPQQDVMDSMGELEEHNLIFASEEESETTSIQQTETRDKKESLFEIPVMDDIDEARLDVEAAEVLRKQARERMHRAILTLPLQIGDDAELRDRVIKYIYWFAEDIPTTWLKEAFELKTHQLVKIAGNAFVSLKCQKCEQPVSVTSRSKLQGLRQELKERQNNSSIPSGSEFRCDMCREIEHRERQQRRKTEYAAQELRLRELEAMSYQDYLQTPEWKARRAEHLKRAAYRCQVCNTRGVLLHVHHRTYERRGNEYFKDLIVLCEECHSLYHEQGKLPGDE